MISGSYLVLESGAAWALPSQNERGSIIAPSPVGDGLAGHIPTKTIRNRDSRVKQYLVRNQLRTTIGSRIRELRKRLDLTQKEFGKRVGGLDSMLISKYENGRVGASLEVLIKICEATGESLDWLVRGRRGARKV